MKEVLNSIMLDEVHDAVTTTVAHTPGFGRVAAVDIRPNRYESRSRTWLVTVETADGPVLEVFCKAGPGRAHNAIGDPSGIDYEAFVYEQILGPLKLGAPELYGRVTGAQSGWSYLILSSLASYLRVNKSPEQDAIVAAAGWLGRSHRVCSSTELVRLPEGLNRYRAETFRRWMTYAVGYHTGRCTSMEGVQRGELRTDIFGELAAAETTLVHGDFYPDNVLVRHEDVKAVDWEWGASGAGEIDLAALTEGWPDDVSSASLAAYTEGRWPEGAPYDVARMVTRARLYLHARWLGGRPDRRDDPEAAEYLETTAEIASQLGALG